MTLPEYMAEKLIPPDDDGMFTDRKRLLRRLGNANWRAFQALDFGLERLLSVAEVWKNYLDGIEYPWLVWSIDHDWCYLQQRLVLSVGWTPVVGYDPRRGAPTRLVPEAVLVDFNADLQLPILYMHFPIDFIFVFAPRLAFWHSDLLCPPDEMRYLADLFHSLKDGEIAITKPDQNWFVDKLTVWRADQRRFWELAGCITRAASRDLFDHGCSIWQGWPFHPNCPDAKEFRRRFRRYWDHSAGLLYWHERYNRPVKLIPEARLAQGHFTQIGKPNFRRVTPNNESRDAGLDLRVNFTIEQAAAKMGILDLLKG